jgi:RNA polymerase sigma factor (sigma-70 family)
MTDPELWEHARAGSTDAFGQLFDRHAKAVYNFCFRACGDWSTAEDLMSIVFLEAWRRIHRTQLQRDSALPFLLGIAVNVVRNQRRSFLRYRRALERSRPVDAAGDVGDLVVARLDAERQMGAVQDALKRLPRDQRDVVALCVGAHLSYDDAASALGIPVGTVRSRLARARHRLTELVESGGHDQEETNPVSEGEKR